MRAFIALELPGWYAVQVNEYARQLAQRLPGRFMPPQNYHVTTAFLGSVSDAAVRGAMDVLDCTARLHNAIKLEPVELGHFGKRGDATLWLGFKQNDGLMGVAQEVRDQLEMRGLVFDEKRFLPHLTLARRIDLTAGSLEGTPFPGSCMVQRLTLFKSTLSSEGATYEPLYTVELPGLPCWA